MSIDPGTSIPGRSGWVIYYRSPRITITSRWVETPDGRFALAEIHGVVRELSYEYTGRMVALIAGGGEILLAMPFVIADRSGVFLGAGIVAAFGVSIGVLVDARRNPRWMELRMTHRGEEVQLFGTRDKVEFERVRRALIRAVEVDRDPLP
jgi:hypothetical protein